MPESARDVLRSLNKAACDTLLIVANQSEPFKLAQPDALHEARCIAEHDWELGRRTWVLTDMGRDVIALLRRRTPSLRFAHAYTPNEAASYGGGEHLVLEAPFLKGRLYRARGDALCKPRRKFWGLHDIVHYVPSKICKRCRELAERHGFEIPPWVEVVTVEGGFQVMLSGAPHHGPWPQREGAATAADRLRRHLLWKREQETSDA